MNKVFETEWFTIDTVTQLAFPGKPYYRLSCQDAVSIMPITKKGEILLIRQYRPAISIQTLEFPSGYINDKETPRETTARELKEETGYVCQEMKYLSSFKIAPSRINNTVYAFCGVNAEQIGSNVSVERGIETVLVSQAELTKLILSDKFPDPVGIAMFWLAKSKEYL